MTVTVFTNPSNPQCKATEQELSKLGVRYVAVDLTQNPSTFEQIKDAASSKFRSSSRRIPHGADIAPTSSASWRKASRRRRGNSSQASRQPEGTNPKRQ